MAKDFTTMEDSNPSSNIDIHQVSDPARRVFLKGATAASISSLLSPWLSGCASLPGSAKLGFVSIPATDTDTLNVPKGYMAQPIAAWGEPIGIPNAMPAFRDDASNS